MTATYQTPRSDRATDAMAILGIPTDHGWRPAGIHEAVVMLDRIARYCEASCDVGIAACPGPACPLWSVERAAAEVIERRRLDAEG